MRRRGARLLLAVAAATSAAGAAPPAAPPSFERDILFEGTGRVAFRLDAAVYEGARADLGDLRVTDGNGREVPYVIDRAEPRRAGEEVRPAVRNRGWRADGAATAVLDFGRRLEKERLRLRLSGDSFRRRVAVEGSDDADSWTTLVDEAWVFAVPGPQPFRYETVDLPVNDFRRLRVVVHPSPDERGRPAIDDAVVPVDGWTKPREEALAPRWSVAEDTRARETWLTLDLGARHQPFHAVDIDVADERFFREARVEARLEPHAPGRPVAWRELGQGVLYRLEHGGRRRECLRVQASGRERALRVRIRNRDDRPLSVRAVAARVPVERVLFEAQERGRYRLTYGSADRPAPSYDLARTTGDLETWGETARPARLGPPSRLAAGREEPRPWTERHPSLLWAGLLAVVLVLGALTYGALRRAG